MKVLFVCSGNKKTLISPIVQAQANSLLKFGIAVEIFPIKGKGIKGYLKNFFHLRRVIKETNFDVIHAHYGISGLLAFFANAKSKLVVSLMGSEIYASIVSLWVFRLFTRYCWHITIVKSQAMSEALNSTQSDIRIIPNGVDLNTFYPLEKDQARKELNIKSDKPLVLFPSNPNRAEKNFPLAQKICTRLNLKLIWLDNVPHQKVNLYYNAADVVLLTSSFEGSPNAIKEAMAANRPIVSTKVGDVEQNLSNTSRCHVCSHDREELARALSSTINNNEPPGSLQRLLELELDDESVAKRIIKVYQNTKVTE